jgi:putative ubiquitin-RnfH superfamily antitoxin RatB of RatAB toxin-antitoxin module
MAKLRIEVVHALAGRQAVVELQLPAGTTAGQAAEASGLAAVQRIGIGGKEVPADRLLRDGDRVELLRPLAADPKEARRRRARIAKRR